MAHSRGGTAVAARLRPYLSPAFGPGGQTLAAVALAAGLAAWWLRSVPFAQVLRHAWPRQLVLFAGVLALNLVVGALRTWRWMVIVRPIRPIAFGDLYWIQAGANLANLVTPVRAGDVSRLWWLSRRHQVPTGQAAVTLMCEHLFDIGTTAVMLIVGTAGAAAVLGAARPAVLALAGAAAVALFLTVLVSACLLLSAPAAASLARWLPTGAADWVGKQSELFRGAMTPLRSARVVVPAALISVAVLAVDGLNFGLLLHSLGVSVPVLNSLFSYLGAILAYAVPSPGGFGNVELFGSWMVTMETGLEAAASSGAVLLWHLVEAGTIIAIGALALARIGLPRPGASRPPA